MLTRNIDTFALFTLLPKCAALMNLFPKNPIIKDCLNKSGAFYNDGVLLPVKC